MAFTARPAVSTPRRAPSTGASSRRARACTLAALAALAALSTQGLADPGHGNDRGLPLLVATVNVHQQELESLLAEYVRWGGEVTHGQVVAAFQHFRRDGAQLAERHRASADWLGGHLELLGEIDPKAGGGAVETRAGSNGSERESALDSFAKTDRLLEWWDARASVVLDRLGPEIAALEEGDAIVHYGIRRQLDLLGDDLLALQLAAFERQAHIERALEVRDRMLARQVRGAYAALGIGTALVLSMLGYFLHLKARAAGELRSANDRLQVKVEEARRLAGELEHNATHDQLTGLYNRHGFVAELKRTFADAESSHGIVFIDLDGFKSVNDTAGHAAGDALLRRIGALLAGQAGEHGTAARFGGDEFVLLLPRCRAGTLRGVARSACELLSAMDFSHDGRRFPVGGSFGAVRFEPGATTPEALMKSVDEACYESKSRGGGHVVFRTLSDEGAPGADNVTPIRSAA